MPPLARSALARLWLPALLVLAPAASALPTRQDPPPAPPEAPAGEEPRTDPEAPEEPAPPPPPTKEDARAAMAAGDLERARRLWAEVCEASPDDVEAWLGRADADAAANDLGALVRDLGKAADLAPDDGALEARLAQACLDQAMADLQGGDGSVAEMALLDARRFFGDAAEKLEGEAAAKAWMGAARATRAGGDEEDAMQCVRNALASDEDHVAALVEKGSLHFARYFSFLESGDTLAAREEKDRIEESYQAALKADPSSAFAMNGLGWLALQSGENDQGIEWFQKSLLADPTLDDSYAQLRNLLSADKDARKRLVGLLDEVVAAARKQGERATAVALFWRGGVKAQLRDEDGLIADFEECAKLEPTFATNCGVQVAKAENGKGDKAAAAKRLLALSQKDPQGVVAAIRNDTNPSAVALACAALADHRYQSNDLRGARELFRLAAEVMQNNASLWNNYALLARDTRQFEEAYQAYEKALALDPNNPALLNDTAVVLHYNLNRDLDRARDLYERAAREAKRVIGDSSSDSMAQESAQIALRDATNNLRKLSAGDRTDG